MKAISALLSITDQKYGTTYIYVTIGGQPQSFANTIALAMAGARTVLDSRRLAMLVISAIGHRRLLSAKMFTDNEPDLAHAQTPDYRYDIELPALRPRQIRVFEISDAGNETKYYDGALDNFINVQFKKLRKPRGRTPAGFSSRSEWEEHYNARARDAAPAFADSQMTEDIARDRRKHPPLAAPNLVGVREYTPEEREEKRKANRKILRDRHRKE